MHLIGKLPRGWRGEVDPNSDSYLIGMPSELGAPMLFRPLWKLEDYRFLLDLEAVKSSDLFVVVRLSVDGEGLAQQWTGTLQVALEQFPIGITADVLISTTPILPPEGKADVFWCNWWERVWESDLFVHPLFCDGGFNATVLGVRDSSVLPQLALPDLKSLDEEEVLRILTTKFGAEL